MCFSAKLLMECILLLAVIPALLLAGPTPAVNITNGNISLSAPTSPSIVCENRATSTPAPIRLPPVLARVKVSWNKRNPCQGEISLSFNFTTVHLCQSQALNEFSHGLCEERRCGRFLKYVSNNNNQMQGLYINDNLTVTNQTCPPVFISCASKDNKELLAYKVVTGLLLVLVLLVILLRFAWPAYLAFRKRFSQQQQNRWIGPTQSQSVSYHRSQGGHLKNDTVKRQSYPGLERLSVNPSREPSSNRNSDYDSYSYN
ncbi:uncharacterized protein [Salminus brasiliensis]|uniref:uncharacterized protein n=1 Tax=Salminus brasiliensis TaxID=930266 RepID=UPI003B82DE2B